LFAERSMLLARYAQVSTTPANGRLRVGIPMALSTYQLLPFRGTLFDRLGLQAVVSPGSSAAIIRRGAESVASTPCFPVKVAHGHVLHLNDQAVDYLWLPSVLDLPSDRPNASQQHVCPYVAGFPYQFESAAALQGLQGRKILRPPVRFSEGPRGVARYLQVVRRDLGVSAKGLRHACDEAWDNQTAFEAACRARGREILAGLPSGHRAIVIVSRPYTGCDMGAYLNIPGKLRKLGLLAIPMDFLDEQSTACDDDPVLQGMYWKYGRAILQAARVIRDDPRLHAVYLTSFACGPDSFTVGHFQLLMSPKPSLVLEVDEHSADAGAQTRLEAFLDSLENSKSAVLPSTCSSASADRQSPRNGKPRAGVPRTLYIPWMGDQSHGLAAAFRACGQHAQVMPIADRQSLAMGRRLCSGKECLPFIITAGDMVRVTQRADFNPSRTAFFMPGGSGPCRFGQYHYCHQVLLQELGLGHVPVVCPSDDVRLYEEWRQIGTGVLDLAWSAICVFDVLHKARLAIRPYEIRRGDTDQRYQHWCERMAVLIERKPTIRQMAETLAQAALDFGAIAVDGHPRPRIGVVGEIYVRQHDFANGELLRQLESLGAETVLSGVPEWHYYTNWLRMSEARRNHRVWRWLANVFYDHIQRRRERRINAFFRPLLGPIDEPPTRELLDLAKPYIHPSLRGGEAVLSIGKIRELSRQGCHGVVHVMPFSCMPSAIADGVIRRLTSQPGAMPVLTVCCDGHEDPALRTRLEAFLWQARAFQARGPSQIGHRHSTNNILPVP
jgi:predicted nucleotide-binding protein (sugar kinase/HSP70/actin superfamily)